MSLVPMTSMTSGWLLSDSSSQWKGVKSGRVFKALMDGEHANPVTVVDEIDKARADTQYDPLGVPCSLLEHDTALRFTDEFAKLANDERGIPAPILNRMNVFNVETPTLEAVRQIAREPHQGIRNDHDWGSRFGPDRSDDVLDQLCLLAPRDMRSMLMTGFGNARLDGRCDIPWPTCRSLAARRDQWIS